MKLKPLSFLKQSFFYSRNGAVRISFEGPVDFSPFDYPELTKLGVWKIPPYMDDYYLFCTAKEIPALHTNRIQKSRQLSRLF